MRVEFVRSIKEVLTTRKNTVFVTGDLGFNAFESLQNEFGKRFLNAGVAEQNMIGVAAGMAIAGAVPWVYSIAPFAVYRPFEQIRNDVCLHGLPVHVVGNGGGFTYGVMGSTHHALEDLGILKTLPNMSLFFPCSNNHVAASVKATDAVHGPTYLRLSISGFQNDVAPIRENAATLTRTYVTSSAPRVTIIAAGHAAQIAIEAHATRTLRDAELFGVARFPFDLAADDELRASVTRTKRVIFIEEHYADGGMGESFRAAWGDGIDNFRLLAVRYSAQQRYGSAAFHLGQAGLTPEAIVAMAREVSGT